MRPELAWTPQAAEFVRALDRVARLVERSRADADAARWQRDAVVDAVTRSVARLREHEQRLVAARAYDAERWEREIEPRLSGAEAVLGVADGDVVLSTVGTLLESYGGLLEWRTKRDFDRFMTTDNPLDLGPARGDVPSPAPPSAAALGSIGAPALPPGDGLLRGRAALEGLVPDELATAPGRGAHLAAPRAGRPIPYTHHGIAVGDGTVVHFTGEPGSLAQAAVARQPFAEFLADTPLDQLTERTVTHFDGQAMAGLLPNVVVLRALSQLDATGYSLLTHNCEHFATWAQLGAHFSAQVAAYGEVLARVAALRPELREVIDLVNIDFADDLVTIAREPFTPTPPEAPAVLDLGRAFWADDLGAPVVWMPLREPAGAAPGGPDRPWGLGDLTQPDAWSRNCPSTLLRPDWHASLVWLEGFGAWWLTSDDRWLVPAADPIVVIEQRLTAATRVLVSYLETTHGPSRVLSLVASLGGDRLIADLFAKFAPDPPGSDGGDGPFGPPRPQ